MYLLHPLLENNIHAQGQGSIPLMNFCKAVFQTNGYFFYNGPQPEAFIILEFVIDVKMGEIIVLP